jgi:hypothetical protein
MQSPKNLARKLAFYTPQRLAQIHCHHEQLESKFKYKSERKYKDSTPYDAPIMPSFQQGSPDIILPAIAPVLVPQTQAFKSANTSETLFLVAGRVIK